MIFSSHDEFCMRRALRLAKRGEGRVSPNPLVGAVLLKKGKIIAEGWHRRFGRDHAEIEALKNARKKEKSIAGATLYVTLEPCVQRNKKTPPCVPALIASGMRSIVIAAPDSNPAVSGRGMKALKAAGISVKIGCLEKEATVLNEKYNKWMKTGIPFITLKVAMSLDGKIATRTGDAKWITGEAARAAVKKMRDCNDAIFVGCKTVVLDDPTLSGQKKNPRRIILDSKLHIPARAKVLRDSNVLVVTTPKAPAEKIADFKKWGIPLHIMKTITLAPLLRTLGRENISSILVEGGAEIFGSFLDEKLVDRFSCFIAPKIIGGAQAKSAVEGKGIAKLAQALSLSDVSYQRYKKDFFISGRLSRSGKSVPREKLGVRKGR